MIRRLSFIFALFGWLAWSAPAQAPIAFPRVSQPPCQAAHRQAWRRGDVGITTYRPCAPERLNAFCIYYPSGFVDYDAKRDCAKGKACAQVQHAPGLYCWDNTTKQMQPVAIPDRENPTPHPIPVRK